MGKIASAKCQIVGTGVSDRKSWHCWHSGTMGYLAYFPATKKNSVPACQESTLHARGNK